MQPYPWRTLYLEPPFCVRLGDYPPDYLIQNRQLVCIRNSIQELFKNCFFSSCWHDIGFGGSLFLFRILLKSIQKLIFPAFGTILVLVAACFYSNVNLKKYSKIVSSSFWQDLGFGGSFFLQKNCKKYKKDTSSKRSHTLGEPYT